MWVPMAPEEIRLAKDRTSLAIRWPSGVTQHLAAGLLRRHCRSSTAVRAAIGDAEQSNFGTVCITGIEQVGGYAIHLAFSDGEERGIYPWSLLRSIGE